MRLERETFSDVATALSPSFLDTEANRWNEVIGGALADVDDEVVDLVMAPRAGVV